MHLHLLRQPARRRKNLKLRNKPSLEILTSITLNINLKAIKYHQLTDEALMLLIKKSNNKAFDELYHRYSKKILNFFYRKLFQDSEKANDLFLKIIEKSNYFDDEKSFSTWIYTMAYNMCKNEYRSLKVRSTIKDEFDLNGLIELPSFNNFVHQFDSDYFMTCLNSELESLTDNHKQTFILRHKELLSINEISIIMECSEGTVKSRLFYAIKTLSKKLQKFKEVKEAYYEN